MIAQGHIHLPFALQHPQVTLGLSNIIQDTMYAQLGGKALECLMSKKYVTLFCQFSLGKH